MPDARSCHPWWNPDSGASQSRSHKLQNVRKWRLEIGSLPHFSMNQQVASHCCQQKTSWVSGPESPIVPAQYTGRSQSAWGLSAHVIWFGIREFCWCILAMPRQWPVARHFLQGSAPWLKRIKPMKSKLSEIGKRPLETRQALWIGIWYQFISLTFRFNILGGVWGHQLMVFRGRRRFLQDMAQLCVKAKDPAKMKDQEDMIWFPQGIAFFTVPASLIW